MTGRDKYQLIVLDLITGSTDFRAEILRVKDRAEFDCLIGVRIAASDLMKVLNSGVCRYCSVISLLHSPVMDGSTGSNMDMVVILSAHQSEVRENKAGRIRHRRWVLATENTQPLQVGAWR
jgi:hypothetical protein